MYLFHTEQIVEFACRKLKLNWKESRESTRSKIADRLRESNNVLIQSLKNKHLTKQKSRLKFWSLGFQKRLWQKYGDIRTGGPKQNFRGVYATIVTKDEEDYKRDSFRVLGNTSLRTSGNTRFFLTEVKKLEATSCGRTFTTRQQHKG